MKRSAVAVMLCLGATALTAVAGAQTYHEILPAGALKPGTQYRRHKPAVPPPPRGVKDWSHGAPAVPQLNPEADRAAADSGDPDDLRGAWASKPRPEDLHASIERFLATPGDRSFTMAPRLMGATASASGNAWTQIGQGIYQVDNPHHGHPDAGRVHAAAYAFDNSQNATPLWLGGCGGGLWKATGLGTLFAVWVPISDNLPGSPSVGAFLVQPGNSNNILIGSGDYQRYGGDGLYKTTNGGTSWRRTSLTPIPNAFERILADVSDPTGNTVIAEGTSGIWRSTNFGDSWTRVYAGATFDLAQNQSSPNIWYAGIPGVGLYRSRDGGMTFPTSTNPADGDISQGIDSGCYRVNISISASDPQYVYAITADQPGNLNGVWRSSDYGSTFTAILPASPDNLSGGQGFDAIAIAVDPTDPDRLYCGMAGMAYTENATADTPTWVQNHLPETDGGHSDYTSFTFQPNSTTLVITSDGGCFFYDIVQHTVSGLTNLEGLNLEQLCRIDGTMANSYDTPEFFVAGLQDNGIVKYDANLSTSLLSLATGDGGYGTIQSDNSSVIAMSDGSLWDRYLSLDAGATLSKINLSLAGSGPPFAETLDPRLGLGTPDIYTPNYNNDSGGAFLNSTIFYKPADTGTDWATVGPALPNGFFVRLIDQAMNGFVNALYTSSNKSGNMFELEGALGSMTATDRTPPIGVDPASVSASVNADKSAFQPDTVYYVTNSGSAVKAFLSTDRGLHWTDATGDAAQYGATFNKLIGNPGDLTNLFLATTLGVLRSDNGGKNWYPYMSGLPAVQDVMDININFDRSTAPLLHVGTNGRGFWERTVIPDAVLTGVTVATDPVTGGLNDTGTVTLDRPAGPNGANVLLSVGFGPASVPASVFVPAGATSADFTITTYVVTSVHAASVTASYHDVTVSDEFHVQPIGPVSVTFAPNPVPGSLTSTGTVTLDEAAAPGDITVALSTANAAVANPTVTTVTIPAGSISGTFTVATTAVTAPVPVAITATANGRSATGTLTVRQIGVASLVLASYTIRGGTAVRATYTLDAPAAPGSIILTSSTSDPLLARTNSSQITIVQGAITGSFAVVTNKVRATTSVKITATANGIGKTVTLILTP